MPQYDAALTVLVGLLEAALPSATVKRNETLPEVVPDGGLIILHDGEEISREELIGVRHYDFVRSCPLELYALGSDDAVRTAAIGALWDEVAAVLGANETLQGTVDYAFLQDQAVTHDSEEAGGESQALAAASLILEYQGSDPAG